MARVPTNPDHAKARVFFKRVLSFTSAQEEAVIVAVLHVVDSSIPFTPVLNERFPVKGFLGKPSSIQDPAQAYLTAALPSRQFILRKTEFKEQPGKIFSEVLDPPEDAHPKRIVLLDIGGYFAPSPEGLQAVHDAVTKRGYTLAGIVEDTQNGHKRYKAALAGMASPPSFRVYSVAESPLKKPENHLVGVAVTFSIEALLRQSNLVLQSRRAGVIGFGPIGRSVAHSLRNRGIAVSVCEIDAIRLAQAAAQGFRVFDYRQHFEDFARDLNLIVSATGAGAGGHELPLNQETIRLLRRGTFVASVTSQDDEIDLDKIRDHYDATPLNFNNDVAKWVLKEEQRENEEGDLRLADSSNSPSFYLMLGGDAVNFRHEGVIGPAIQLLQGEILACIGTILRDTSPPTKEVKELDEETRQAVASAWLDQYLVDSAVSELD